MLEAPGVPQITAAANSPGVLGNPPVVVGPEAWGTHLGWVGGLGTDPGPGPGVSGLGIIRCDFASSELTDKRLEEDGRASIPGRIRSAPLVLEGSGGSSATVGRCVHSMVGLHRWPLWGNHRMVWSSRPELAIGEDREWHPG